MAASTIPSTFMRYFGNVNVLNSEKAKYIFTKDGFKRILDISVTRS